MSFLTALVGVAKAAVGFLKKETFASKLAKTAILGFAQNKINKSIQKQQQKRSEAAAAARDGPNTVNRATVNSQGQRIQITADTNASIPVVYGQAYVTGSIVDAAQSADGSSMWYALAIAEKTGNLLNGTPSVISIDEAYWNNYKLRFGSDGVTVIKGYDANAIENADIANNIKIYAFSGSSNDPIPVGNSGTPSAPAYNLFPNWNSTYTMPDLVFALVKVNYSASASVKGLGTVSFKLNNTMTKPGDCIYDYMTNTRYGAGIPPEEIDA